jgi:hypothetical protein
MSFPSIRDLVENSETWLDLFGRCCEYCLRAPERLDDLATAFRSQGDLIPELVEIHQDANRRTTEIFNENGSTHSILVDTPLDKWTKDRVREIFHGAAWTSEVSTIAIVHGIICAIDAEFTERSDEVSDALHPKSLAISRCPSPVMERIRKLGEGVRHSAELLPDRLRLLLNTITNVRTLYPVLPEFRGVLPRVKLERLDTIKWQKLEQSLRGGTLRVAVVQFLNRIEQLDKAEVAADRVVFRNWTPTASQPLGMLLQRVLTTLHDRQIHLAVFPEVVLPQSAIEAARGWLLREELFKSDPLLLAFGSYHHLDPQSARWKNTALLYWVGMDHGKSVCEAILAQEKRNPYSYEEGGREVVEAISPNVANICLVSTPVGRIGVSVCRDLLADQEFLLAFKALAVDWALVPSFTPQTELFGERMRDLGYWGVSSAFANSCAAMHWSRASSQLCTHVSRIYLPYRERAEQSKWQGCSSDPCPEFGAIVHVSELTKLRERDSILCF